MLSQSNLWRGSSRLTNTAVPTYRMSPADHEVSHQNNGPVTLMGASERFRNCIGGRSAPPGLLLPHLIMAANGCDRNGGSGLRRDCGLKTKAGGHANVPFSLTLTLLPSRWTRILCETRNATGIFHSNIVHLAHFRMWALGSSSLQRHN